MGKRELLIVAAFFAVGLAAWRIAVPGPAEPGQGFSLDRLARLWRSHGPARLAHAEVATEGRMPVPRELVAVRITGVLDVDVEGEARDDLAWQLVVDANGPDEASAQATATGTHLRQDSLGDVLALSVRVPDEGQQTSRLLLRVPARLKVRIENARRTSVTAVSGVRLENLVGDVEVRDVSGLVDGAHRNGSIVVDQAGDVSLTLANSEAVVRGVNGPASLVARNGSLKLEHGRGETRIEVSDQSVTVVEPTGAVRVSGGGGDVRIERPRAAVDLDLRRVEIGIDVDRAVPITVFAADARVAIEIDDTVPLDLDIASEKGTIDASAVGGNAERRDGDARYERNAGHGAHLAVRGVRSAIVITPRK